MYARTLLLPGIMSSIVEELVDATDSPTHRPLSQSPNKSHHSLPPNHFSRRFQSHRAIFPFSLVLLVELPATVADTNVALCGSLVSSAMLI